MKSILLFKDNSIKLSKNIQKNIIKKFDEIKYILFLADQQNETFILQKPKEFMKSFHKASITFESVIIQHSMMNEETSKYPNILHKISKEILSLTELYSYLHSLNRIRLWNKLSNSNECAVYELIEFSYFELTILDKDENILFHKKMDVSSELGQFGEREIEEAIDQIYSPVKLSDKYINISEDSWKVSKYIDEKMNLCGVYLPFTKSVTFLYNKGMIHLKERIKSVYHYTMTYNKNVMSTDECHSMVDSLSSSDYTSTTYGPIYNSTICGAIRFQDLWTRSHEEFIEIIAYLDYLNSTSIVVSELNDYGKLEGIYSTITQIQLELFGERTSTYKGVECSNDNPISLETILNLI